jgi:uncharacterized MAPEG superfamily protein
MKTELQSLVWVTILTAVMWIPYVLDRVAVLGLRDTVGYPLEPKPQSPWARRMKAAHDNAVENHVVFAALGLVANTLGISNGVTALAASLYFWARFVHVIAYTFALPWIRTLAFVAGFVAQAVFAWQILVR